MTSKRKIAWVAGIATALVVAGCSQMPKMMMQHKGGGMPAADAMALWKHLQSPNYQSSFKLFPGKGKMYAGTQPHGAFLTTYVNETAYKALSGGTTPLPVGSILVKENYMPDKSLAAVTVMYKVAGFDPQNSDWYWLKRSADGKVEASGKPAGCIACHKPAARDYVITEVKM